MTQSVGSGLARSSKRAPGLPPVDESNYADLDASTFVWQLPSRPYPGLRPFEKSEWPIFFGRERTVDQIINRLQTQRLLMVHGDSGCGKSSLIAAGVLPRLEQEAARGGLRWRTAIASPGDDPLRRLARELATLCPEGQREPELEIRRILNYGVDGPEVIAKLLRRNEDEQICLLIDQFEELFAHAKRCGSQQAKLLIQFLIGAQLKNVPGLSVVLTMRSEFLGACARFSGFAELVNARQFLLPRIGRAELLRSIREPAPLYDGQIELDLAERLIEDSATCQEQLPLIQHGLMLLHREKLRGAPRAGPWRLGLEDYGRKGKGLGQLLSDHADTVAAEAKAKLSKPDPQSPLIEQIFCALTDVNADGRAVRNPQKVKRLLAVTGASEADLRVVLDAFRAEGVSLLRPYGDQAISLDDSIDVSHEALIRSWCRIADPSGGWLMREFKNGLIWRSLLVQCESFESNPANVLSPAATEERASWLNRHTGPWSERYGGGWDRVQRLVAASVKAREESLQREKEAFELRAKKREGRLLGWGFFALLALSIVAVALAVSAQSARMASDDERDKAKEAIDKRDEADRARAQADATAKVALDNEAAANQDKAKQFQAFGDALEATDVAIRAAKLKIPEDSEALEDLNRVQQTLDEQLVKVATLAPRVATLAPRVYLQISERSQRAAADRFASKVSQQSLGADPIKVIPADLHGYVRDELRCFRKAECEEAKQLLEVLNAQLAQPKLRLTDVSATYEHSKTIRPRHYEVWFAPGTITVVQ